MVSVALPAAAQAPGGEPDAARVGAEGEGHGSVSGRRRECGDGSTRRRRMTGRFVAALTLMAAPAGAGGPQDEVDSLQAEAVRAVSQCMGSGGAEGFGAPSGAVSERPPGIEVPAGATVSFWRIPTAQGALFAYSGYEGRTNLCGVVASRVDLRDLSERVAGVLAAQDHWISATPPASDWARSGVESERYWGDSRNTSLHGAALVIARPAGSDPVLQLHYHATRVF